jgi:fucose permease
MFMHLPQIQQTQEFRPGREGDPVLGRSIWSYRHTVLAALGIFLYVGVEVGLASIGPNYFKTQGVDSLSKASYLVAWYWGGALIGRLLGSLVLTRVKAGKLLGLFGLIATLCVFISMATHGSTAIYAVVLCGFFNSIMFPNIFALGIAGPAHQQRLRTDHDGGSRRRDRAAADRRAGRQVRQHPDSADHSRHLLPLHRLLWLCGVQANADGASVGWIGCAH